MTVADELTSMVDALAPIRIAGPGIWTGTSPDGRVRRAFVVADMAAAAARITGAPFDRLLAVVHDVTWTPTHTGNGAERRFFETREMVDAILAATQEAARVDP